MHDATPCEIEYPSTTQS